MNMIDFGYYSSSLQIIKNNGYLIKQNFENLDSLPYCYTIGREWWGKSDFVLLNSTNDVIISEVIKKFDHMTNCQISINYSSKILIVIDTLFINQKPARFLINKIDPNKNKNLCSGCWDKSLEVTEPVGLYQIIYPDENNILPGEECFNEEFSQPDLSV